MKRMFPGIPRHASPDGDLKRLSVVRHWGFFEADDLVEGAQALMMLDIDFGRKCSLRCPSCFRKANRVDDDPHCDLTYAGLLQAIDEARSIGLRAVKVCGAGEPLENPLLLPLARDLTRRGIGLSVFTKGHVLGDDEHVARVFGDYGIADGRSLCAEFSRLDTSFLVSFQSPYPEVQESLVGGVRGYAAKRNRALELLAEAGFNGESPTRLAMCANPMVRPSFDGLFETYVFARERNILPVNAALMVSGTQIDAGFLRENDVPEDMKERFFVRVYEYNLRHGINTPEQLIQEGISCMPGIHPCNQIAAGLYLTANGSVLRCPGDHGAPLGNVQDASIVRIWQEHRNWEYSGKFNCHCPFKDGITLPENLYSRVLQQVLGDAAEATWGVDVKEVAL